jgi:hypothetical protein
MKFVKDPYPDFRIKCLDLLPSMRNVERPMILQYKLPLLGKYNIIGKPCATQQQRLYHRAVNISLKLNLRDCDEVRHKRNAVGTVKDARGDTSVTLSMGSRDCFQGSSRGLSRSHHGPLQQTDQSFEGSKPSPKNPPPRILTCWRGRSPDIYCRM